MKRLTIVVALITAENDFQQEQAAVAQATASRLGVDLQVIFADNDSVNQSLQLVKLIQGPAEGRPDAIVVEPVGTAMPQVAKAAAQAGIGWVVLNRPVDYLSALRPRSSVPLFGVSSNHRSVGRIQGEQINALVAEGGTVLYVEGPSASDTSQERRRGMLEKKRPDIAVKTVRGDWTEISGYQALKSWLRLPTSKELNVRVVACQNDAMAMGAHKALNEESGDGKGPKLLLTGCDGVPNRGQKYVQQGILAATVIVKPLTGLALEILVNALRSKTQPPEHTITEPEAYPALDKLRIAAAPSRP